MNDRHLDGMAVAIGLAFKNIHPDTLDTIQRTLARYWEDKVADVWMAEDVILIGDQHKIKIDPTLALMLLSEIKSQGQGITHEKIVQKIKEVKNGV